MGCYLSSPDENVYIVEGKGNNYTYATASCQGWRKEQEDAEDCITNFDGDNSSLFILCDGHGGSEVAKYTVRHLPDMIKNHPHYKEGDYAKALYYAFLEFDTLLRNKDTLEELYRMAMDEECDRKDNQSETDGGADSGGDRPNSAECSEPVAGSSSGFSDGPSSSNGRPRTVVDDVDADTLRKEASEPLTEIFKQFAQRSGTLFNPSPVVKSSKNRRGGDELDEEAGTSSDKDPEPSSSTTAQDETSQGSSSQSIKSLKENLLAKVIQRYFADVEEEDADEDEDSEYEGAEETESDDEEDEDGDEDEDDDDEEDDDDDEDEEDEDEEGEEDEISESDGASRAKGDEDGDDEGEEDEEDVAQKTQSKKHKFKKHHRRVLKPPKTSSDDDEEYVDDEEEVENDTSDDNEDEFNDDESHEKGQKRKRSPSDDGSEVEEEEDEDDIDQETDCLLPPPESEMTPEERDELQEKLRSLIKSDKERTEGTYDLPRIKGHRPGYDSGCTTIVALVKAGKIYVASVGDSRCLLIRRDGTYIPMSQDHKPTQARELARIYAAKGRVSVGRVNGGLNLTRALGDFSYKSISLPPWRQMICPCPDVRVTELTGDIEYILLACDGIWNSMTNSRVVHFMEYIGPKLGKNLADINVELFRKCIARGTDGDGTGCDNMTSILVRFEQNDSTEQRCEGTNQIEQTNSNSDLKTTNASSSGGSSGGISKLEQSDEMKVDAPTNEGVKAIDSTKAVDDSKSSAIKRRSVRSLDLNISHSLQRQAQIIDIESKIE